MVMGSVADVTLRPCKHGTDREPVTRVLQPETLLQSIERAEHDEHTQLSGQRFRKTKLCMMERG